MNLMSCLEKIGIHKDMKLSKFEKMVLVALVLSAVYLALFGDLLEVEVSAVSIFFWGIVVFSLAILTFGFCVRGAVFILRFFKGHKSRDRN